MLTVSVVSHYPKIGDSPEEQLLRRALTQLDRKEIALADLERIKDEVTRGVIEEQVEAGVELVTDGQIRWDDPVTYLTGKMEGFRLTGLLRYFDTNTFYRQPVCYEELRAPSELVVKDFQFANAVGSVPVKVALTGPYTLARLSQDLYYKDPEEFGKKLASILGEEVKRLAQAGATVIQFEEPALLHFKEEFPLFKKIWTKLASYFSEEIETILFLNFGNLEGLYPNILDLSFTTLGMDLSESSENWRLLEGGGVAKRLLAGIVDARNTRMETEEEIRGMLEKLLSMVSPGNLSVSPNYGLEFLPRAVARRKLAHLSRIVREFREARVKA